MQNIIVKNYKKLEKKVYPVPPMIDKEIARLKLAGMGVVIDKLTKEQVKYLGVMGDGNISSIVAVGSRQAAGCDFAPAATICALTLFDWHPPRY